MIIVIVQRKIKLGKQTQYHDVVANVKQKAQLQPGYINGEILIRCENPEELLVISRWETRKHWDAWVASDERKSFMSSVNDVLEREESISFYEPKNMGS